MRNFLRLAVFSWVLLLCAACEEDKSYVDPGLEVTPNNIAGVWKVAQWSGETLAEGCYVYIEFTRRDRTFTIYQNLDSFTARRITGAFHIDTDAELGAIIRGQYDYGNGDWRHRYIVRDLMQDRMTWIAVDDQEDVTVYERCDAIPDYVLQEVGE